MPRVAIKKKEYMIKDFTGWVLQKARMAGLKQKDIAEMLGIAPSSFCMRLKKCVEDGQNIFSLEEGMVLLKALDATDEEILRLMKL